MLVHGQLFQILTKVYGVFGLEMKISIKYIL